MKTLPGPKALTMGLAGLLAGGGLQSGRAQDPPAPAAVPNTLTKEDRDAGWKLLFDGTTAGGWRGYRKKEMPEGWKVVDGALTRVGKGGDIVTVEAYDHFDLTLEWKIAAGGNSGIMYRVSEDENAPWRTGPEMQVLDNGGHKDGASSLTAAGSCYALYAPSRDVTRPAGEWNQARLLVDGAHVEHWQNGVKIVEYELGSDDWNRRVKESKFGTMPGFGKSPRGVLCLQDHGDEVAYRSIKIRPLPGKEAK